MLYLSCPSRTTLAPARSATRSTKERAFAPHALSLFASTPHFRSSRNLFWHAAPSLPRRTLERHEHHRPRPSQPFFSSYSVSVRRRRTPFFGFPPFLGVSDFRSALLTVAPSASSTSHLARSVAPVPTHSPQTPRASQAVGHPAFGQFSSLTLTHGGGLTPACSGLAALAADARRYTDSAPPFLP